MNARLRQLAEPRPITLNISLYVCPIGQYQSSGHRALWVRPVPRRFLDSIDGSRVRQRTMPSGYQRNPSPCLATWPMPGQAK